MEHSTLPWEVYKGVEDNCGIDCEVDGADNKIVCKTEMPEDALYIVECCNNYPTLQQSNEKLLNALIDVIQYTNKNGDETMIEKYKQLVGEQLLNKEA